MKIPRIGLRASVYMLISVLSSACGGAMVTEEESPRQEPASANGAPAPGNLELLVAPVSGVELTELRYVVTVGDPKSAPSPVVVAQGDLEVARTSQKQNVYAISVPSGTDYVVSLTALSAEACDSITCSAAYGPFGIAPDVATNISIAMTCVDNAPGQIYDERRHCSP